MQYVGNEAAPEVVITPQERDAASEVMKRTYDEVRGGKRTSYDTSEDVIVAVSKERGIPAERLALAATALVTVTLSPGKVRMTVQEGYVPPVTATAGTALPLAALAAGAVGLFFLTR